LDDSAIFTATGLVVAQVLGVCTTTLTGDTATIEVGISDNTALFMPTETATQIEEGTLWVNNADNPSYFILGEQEAATDNLPKYLLLNWDILLHITTANVTAGL